MSKVLWQPSKENIKTSNLSNLINAVNEKFKLNLITYSDFYDWSIENISDFWEIVWDDTDVLYFKKHTKVVDDIFKMPGAKWFESSELNYSQNLLRNKNNDTAIEYYSENRIKGKISYTELHKLVSKVAYSFRKLGLKKGDRVAAVMPNVPETIISMLAVSSIGAIWSSCSPDFGVSGILDRFDQIKPKFLLSVDSYFFKGKKYQNLDKIRSIVNAINTISLCIVVGSEKKYKNNNFVPWDKIINANYNDNKINYEQLPFDHPLYIMFSSGTTGKPKSIVHSAGGTLIQHLKELKYHVDLKENDKIFYYTTCGWMMWNWLVSSLYFGSTIVLYDGSPFYPKITSMLKIMDLNNLTIFGTSAKYISYIESENVIPKNIGNFKNLRTILSTGSPLANTSYDFVYDFWKKDVQLSSISGGTDIISCFALGNPIDPVYKGELQCLGLGMSVKSYDVDGNHMFDTKGELVCDKAFPSMPICFWNDSDGVKYHNAYFDVFDNIWTHGDFISINKNYGVKIFGRSDSTLNPGGVRIGTSEIYQSVEKIEYVLDSLAISQKYKKDERIILFVKLNDSIKLDVNIEHEIRNAIRKDCTPRHVPSLIIQIDDIPYTINGKKVEIAVKDIIHGLDPQNKTALANPESLLLYKNIREIKY